jgi:hypothetical protein
MDVGTPAGDQLLATFQSDAVALKTLISARALALKTIPTTGPIAAASNFET